MINLAYGLQILTLIAGCNMWAQAVTRQAPNDIRKSPHLVFRIGSFDHSSVEFAQGVPTKPVVFAVGKSDPARDWYANQPALVESASGAEKRANVSTPARAITFSLDRAPDKFYEFHASILLESASDPAVQVKINGKQGRFYLRPRLDYLNGDFQAAFIPVYQAELRFCFPGKYLRKTGNIIELEAVEEADSAVSDAGFNYDALELQSEPKEECGGLSTPELNPTVFFRKSHGRMEEELQALIPIDGPNRSLDWADLTIGSERIRQTFKEDRDFGETLLTFWVPEFPPMSHARLVWNAADHRGHYLKSISPEKKWTLLLVPNIHLDIGYSDYQAKVAAIQSRVVGEAVALSAGHPGFRFSLDGEWSLEQFLKTRSLSERQKVIAAIENERLFIPAQYSNELTGFATTETLIRSLYPSANFSRIHKTPFNYANITDVPSYSWSYASILASAGIHYLISGSNNYRGPVLLQGRLNENSPFWWEGPDGGKVLMWYSRHYAQMQVLFGLPPLTSAGRDSIPLFLQMYEHPQYRANAVILFGSQQENTDLFLEQAELAKRWNARFEYPRLQYSGFHEAMRTIQEEFGDFIPVVRGDGGPYWEDGVASDAFYSGIERWNEARALTAEKLSTLSSLINPHLRPDRVALAEMWKDMVLMDEHTWGVFDSAPNPASIQAVSQLEVKDQFAVSANNLADSLTKSSMANIAYSIPAGPNTLVVFNTLNWRRSGLVSVDLAKGKQLVDLCSKKVVPVEIVKTGGGFNRVRFLATDVPSLGYKVFSIQAQPKTTITTQVLSSSILESPYYKVELDPETGSVRSIYDKQLKRDIVNQESPYRFGQYLYVSGGDQTPNSLIQYSPHYHRPDVHIHKASGGRVEKIELTPYGVVAHLQSQDTNTPSIKTEIRLFNDEKKIEFVEDVTKKTVTTKEAVYFAFPFAMSRPQFSYEIQNGVVNPEKDMYPGAGHEWFSVQHWVSVQEGGISATLMPLDSSLVTLGDINRGEWPVEFGERRGTVFSYVMNNYWTFNYRAGQGGHFRFHFIVTSAASTNQTQLSRRGWEEITPLEVDHITWQDKSESSQIQGADIRSKSTEISSQPLGRTEDSFLTVHDPYILLETWKTAEDGNGTILRFLDLGGPERMVRVCLPKVNIKEVIQTDSVERDQGKLTIEGKHDFTFPVRRNGIVTVRVIEVHQDAE